MEIPDKVLHKIQYLCKSIPKVEWSGALFYSIKGSIRDLTKLKIILEDILPLDMGTAGYTEYTLDKRFVDFIEEDFDRRANWKLGHIHSHNTMRVFFSGVDTQELYDNAPNHNFYLSLIVNNYMDFVASIAFIGSAKQEIPVSVEALDENGKPYIVESEDMVAEIQNIYMVECEIFSNKPKIKVPMDFATKVAKIMEPKPVPARVTYSNVPSGNKAFNFSQEQREELWPEDVPAWQAQKEPVNIYSALNIDYFLVKLFTPWSEIRPEDDAEEIINGLEDAGMTDIEVATKVLERYPRVFVEHFKTNKVEDLIMGTQKVLEELEEYIKPYPIVGKSYASIVKMVEKIEEDEFNKPTKQV